MKKILACFLTVMLLLSMAACGEQAAAEVQETSQTDEIEESVEETAPVEASVSETPAEPEEAAEPEEPAEAQTEVSEDVEELPAEEPEEPEPEFRNPLTGEPCDEETYYTRPYAVMFNYEYQPVAEVQTGISKADVVFECYTESYTTRLMAAYKTLDNVGQMGPLRSARLHFAKIAYAYGCNYVHVGMDQHYCRDWMNSVGMQTVDFNINYYNPDNTLTYWFREDNGLSSEHTLYSTGELIKTAAADLGLELETEDNEPWFTFNTKDESTATASGEDCTELTVQMNNHCPNTFHYNEACGGYERWWGDLQLIDYKDCTITVVENVLVFRTDVLLFDDGEHANVLLEGGEGYYATNGRIVPILWSMDDNGRFAVTDTLGTPIELNMGMTWICICKTDSEITW